MTRYSENFIEYKICVLIFSTILAGIFFILRKNQSVFIINVRGLNPLTPNDHYCGRAAPPISKRSILYIYSTNTGTEYFKRGIRILSFFSLQNAVCFINPTYLVPVLFTFYIQGVLN